MIRIDSITIRIDKSTKYIDLILPENLIVDDLEAISDTLRLKVYEAIKNTSDYAGLKRKIAKAVNKYCEEFTQCNNPERIFKTKKEIKSLKMYDLNEIKVEFHKTDLNFKCIKN